MTTCRSPILTVIPGNTGDLIATPLGQANVVYPTAFPQSLFPVESRVDTRLMAGRTYTPRGTFPKIWMNPMRPVSIGCPIPLPRPIIGLLGRPAPVPTTYRPESSLIPLIPDASTRSGISGQQPDSRFRGNERKRKRKKVTKYQEDLPTMTTKRLVFPPAPPYLQREFVKPDRVAGPQGKYTSNFTADPETSHG